MAKKKYAKIFKANYAIYCVCSLAVVVPNSLPAFAQSYYTRTLSITASAYAPGCGRTEHCETRTDTQYLGIPAACVVVGENQIIPGEIFGRASQPRITYLPKGSQISESEYQQMSRSSGVSGNVSAGQYGNYGGSYNSSASSRSNRGGAIVTNVDMIRMQVEATGRSAFWQGPGSKSEYTLRVKMRCRGN